MPDQLSFPDLTQAIYEALADSNFKPGTSLLFDARLSQSNPSGEEIGSRATWIASLREMGISSRCAFVVRSEASRFGLARMLSIYLENLGMEMEIFTEINDALKWLAA